MALIAVAVAQITKGKVMIGSLKHGMHVEHAACAPGQHLRSCRRPA